MMEIEQILSQPWSQRLAWSLLHFLWQGLVIAVLLSVAMTALRRRSANLRYAVACMALIVMVVAPVVTFCLIPAGPTGDAPAGPAVQKDPDVMMPVSECVPPVANIKPSHAPAMVAVPAALPDAGREASAPTIGWTARASRFLRPALPWMVAAWVAGVTLLAIWHIGGWVGLVRLKQSALPLTQAGPETRCVAAARRIARQLGFSKPIRLLKSARIAGPMAVGTLRPAVLMPVTMLTGLSMPHIEAIIAHEIAHLRRCDYLVNLLQTLVETILFYHPAVWWVSGRIRIERENCCDDVAIGVCGDTTTYVAALASLAEASADAGRARPPRLSAAKHLAPGASLSVLARVRRLLGLPADDSPRASRWLAGVLVVVALALAGAFLGANTDPTMAATASAEKEAANATQPADPEVTVEMTDGKCGYVGRVIEAETGKPVEKFDIRIGWTQKPVTDAKDISWYSTIRGAARPGGKFSVRCTIQKSQQQYIYFLILAEGYLPQLVSDKPLSGPFRHTGVVVRLKRGKSIIGRVLDHTGKPVVGGNVFLVSRQRRLELVDGKPEYFTGSSGVTDANGRFKLPGGGEATTHVVVSCKSLHAWLTKIPKTGEEFTIRLPAPATIVLRYDIPGAAAVGVFRVALRTWEMPEWQGLSGDIRLAPTINQKGTVTLSNVTPGVYSVDRRVDTRIGNSGYGRLCDRQRIEATSGQTERINFVRETGVPIVGEIPGLAANACPGASILIEELTAPSGPGKKLEPALLDTVTCGPDGKFKTSRIPPGRYRVCAEAFAPGTPEDASSTGWHAPAFVGSAEVTVPAAGEPARVRLLMKTWQYPGIPAKVPESPATAAARERCWREMGTGDYAKVAGGAAALGVGGDKAATFIYDKLMMPPADPARIKQLIAQFDSAQHNLRQKAHDDLEALDMAALPGLREGAKGDLSAEARTRVNMLLAREPGMLMRMERAIVILAKLDRPRCLLVLRTLAKRDPGAPETKLAVELRESE